VPVTLGDVATSTARPEARRGIGELDGEGEAVGGVVILRSGKNARSHHPVKEKLETLKKACPPASSW
jgi:Cu(I)/Ag(I) efflux system membrane protein CusA/SilA